MVYNHDNLASSTSKQDGGGGTAANHRGKGKGGTLQPTMPTNKGMVSALGNHVFDYGIGQEDATEAALADARPDHWALAAEAIMTTDTFPKGAYAEAEIEGVKVRIAGVAKGSLRFPSFSVCVVTKLAMSSRNTPALSIRPAITRAPMAVQRSWNSLV